MINAALKGFTKVKGIYKSINQQNREVEFRNESFCWLYRMKNSFLELKYS